MAQRNTEERFWARVDQRDPDDCWPWRGYIMPSGYGYLSWHGRSVGAHRVAYELAVGLIPEGLEIDHLCHTADRSCLGGNSCPHRRCCNPSHLEPVTCLVNIRRHFSTDSDESVEKCRVGHDLIGANRYERATGQINCRQCATDSRARYLAKARSGGVR